MPHHHDWPDHEVELIAALCEMARSEVDQVIDERWVKLTTNLAAAEGCDWERRKLEAKIDAFSSSPPDQAAASADPDGHTYLDPSGEARELALLRELRQDQENRARWHTNEANEAFNTLANFLQLQDSDGNRIDAPGARTSLDHFAARLAPLPR